MEKIILGKKVTMEDVICVARGYAQVEFSDEYCNRVNKCRSYVEQFSKEGQAIYGLTTGLGDNCRKFVPEKDREIIQRNHILAHTCSVGEPINEECTRAIMFIMLVHFGCGYTGIRLETLNLLRDMLNNNIVPRVPGHGSVGYVSLEAHIGMVLIGEGKAWYKGKLLAGKKALASAGLKPTVLSSKEGLTIVSGTTSVTAFTALALYDAVTLAKTEDIAASLTLEVLKGTLMSMDERIMKVRPHPDQERTASNIRALLKDSAIIEKYKGHRVQDALSLRCVPQLHGAVKKFIKAGLDVLEIELNSAVDNPLIFEQADGTAIALMGCNADGTYVGMAADVLAIAITDLCKMSACRIDRMLNHLVSELPAFLNKNAAYNNGLMMIQYTAAGLMGELRILSHPAVVDNLATCANQEDYVNMGYNAAKKAYDSVQLAKYICAIELICGAQALDCYENIGPATGTKAVYNLVRKVVPVMECDSPLEPYIEMVAKQVIDCDYIRNVEEKIGKILF
ncbi:HAL/PAL/TAL family ammonia-lyase [Sporomusa termitida]|uniref:Histidine ammonia-lyase n=1 Tax=Sporomusa termitida TaxID=2377 RepID=A0A517DYW0_9FIRM|nr:aromatic amino acid ammonia-lyase [Sporomusa termitida]QDR82544.1 Histidine ammonia-lyase [Sporomusa termitida]